jgi:hypothetical protein
VSLNGLDEFYLDQKTNIQVEEVHQYLCPSAFGVDNGKDFGIEMVGNDLA